MANTTRNPALAKLVAQRRSKVGLTVHELAEKLGTTPQAIYGWERGRCSPRPAVALKVCDVLEITPKKLAYAIGADYITAAVAAGNGNGSTKREAKSTKRKSTKRRAA